MGHIMLSIPLKKKDNLFHLLSPITKDNASWPLLDLRVNVSLIWVSSSDSIAKLLKKLLVLSEFQK